MKKINFLFLAVLISFTISCTTESVKENLEVKNKLEHISKVSIETNTMLVFSMDSIANFKWDSLVILPPYTNLELVSKKFFINFKVLSNTGIQQNDNKCVLVFIENGHIVNYVNIQRGVMDFYQVNDYRLFLRSDANFRIDKKKITIEDRRLQ